MSRKTAVKSPITNAGKNALWIERKLSTGFQKPNEHERFVMKIVERASRVGNGVGRGTWVKGSKATHNPTPSTERGKRRAAKREAAKAAVDESK